MHYAQFHQFYGWHKPFPVMGGKNGMTFSYFFPHDPSVD